MPTSSLIRSVALATGGLLVQGIGRFAYTTVIARTFGPERFALVNTLLSLAIIASLLWPTAAGNAAGATLARDVAAGQPTRPTLRALWRSFLWSLIAIIGGFTAFATFGLGAGWADTALFATLIATWSGYIFVRGVRMGLGQIEAATWWDVLSTAATLAVLAIVVVGRAQALGLLPLSVGYALFAFSGARSSWRVSGGEPKRGELRHDLTGLIAWNSAALVASNGLVQFTMVFAYSAGSTNAAGQFAAAIAVATPASMLAQAVSQVLIPRMSLWQHEDPIAAVRRTRQALVAIGAFLVVAFGAVATFAPAIMSLVYGPDYSRAVNYVRVLLVGVLLFSLTTVASSVLLVTARARMSALVTIASAAVGILSMFALARLTEAGFAAAWGLALGMALSAATHVLLAWKRDPILWMAPRLA